MMNNFLITPIIVLMFAGALGIVLSKRRIIQASVATVASIFAILSSIKIIFEVIEKGTTIMAVGHWQPPFGIILVADRFSAAMMLVCNLLGLACILYSYFDIDESRIRHGFYSMFLALLAGVNGVFLTGDLFNLYVWFEVLLICSFCLLTLGAERKQVKGSLPYVFINLFASSLLLVSIGAVYSVTGSLNMGELSFQLNQSGPSGPRSIIAILFLLAFGIKAAIFPLFFWLPAAYHTPPVSVIAIFSGLLTKAAIYALIRLFTLFFIPEKEFLQNILLIVAVFTMVMGVLGAAGQGDFKRILSFHIISQIGYMVMGIAFFTPLALAGTVLFVIHNILIKSNLFLISGVVHKITGTSSLSEQGGIYRSHLPLAIMFIASAFSLTGLPPLSGFWGKFILAASGFKINEGLVVGISLFVSLITLFSMTKIWINTFWRPASYIETGDVRKIKFLHYPILGLCIISLLPALFPGPILEYFIATGEELMQPKLYVEAMVSLGGLR